MNYHICLFKPQAYLIKKYQFFIKVLHFQHISTKFMRLCKNQGLVTKHYQNNNLRLFVFDVNWQKNLFYHFSGEFDRQFKIWKRKTFGVELEYIP